MGHGPGARAHGAAPQDGAQGPRGPRSALTLTFLAILALIGIAGFAGLGLWQVERIGWKRDLKTRVAARVHGEPVAPPGPERWSEVREDEYLRVRLHGRFLNDSEVFTQAVTAQGGGFWLMTPLESDRGFTVLVNRGFVTPAQRDPATRTASRSDGPVTVTGLLRLTEPKGGFLRDNDPPAGRWFSRDVAAIASAQRLGEVAPYFLDADATPNPGGVPQGGLTVLSFPDNHLGYAVTWFALAAMLAGAAFYVGRAEWRLRRGNEG